MSTARKRDEPKTIAMSSPFDQWSWKPPIDWQMITTIDICTGGKPMRIIIASSLPIQGRNILEKGQNFMEKYNHIRIGWLKESREHADMYAAVVTPSADEADLDVIFSQYRGYDPMFGPGVLAIAKSGA
jgi:proline racemase